MSGLIVNDINVSKLLSEKYAKLGNGWITLLQVPIENAASVNLEAIKTLQSLDYQGIYITLSKDYPELTRLLKEKGVNLDSLVFIDGISQMYAVEKVNSPQVSYVAGPVSVDEISKQVTQIAPTLKGNKKFVFLDSITTVLLYNSLERTLKFTEFLTQSLKMLQVVGIVVSVSKGFANEQLIKELTKISNEVINLQT